MVTLKGNNGTYEGTSEDNKPLNVPINTEFYELDTGKTYYFDGEAWNEEPPCEGGGFTPTSAQLAAMNSGITEEDVTQIGVNENNISLIKHAANTSIYIQETTPTGAVGDYWISAANGVKTYGRTAQLFNIDDRNMFFNGYINLTPDVINTSTGGSMSAIIPCTAGEQYTIAVNSKTLRIAGVATPPADNAPAISPYRQSYNDYNKHTYTYTAPTGAIYLLVTCYLLSVEVADEKSIDDIFGTLMINEGTTAEEFAPYYDWT